MEALLLYSQHGQMMQVHRETGIPESTLYDWKQADWWQDAVGELRQQNADRQIAQYHKLTELALDTAIEGIETMDRSSLSASDIKSLAVTGATATDKARLLLNQPTSIRANDSSVQALADEFRALTKRWDEKQVNVVSEQ